MSGALLCLGTEKGLEALRAAIACAHRRALTVCTFEETGVDESFHSAILATAKEAGIPTARWREFRQDPVQFLRSRDIASILCIGWRYLIPEIALCELSGNVVIAHDSLLPRFRGFAPLATALIAGESETGVTFLRAGPAVDDGEVLWQGRVPIERRDTIRVLIQKVLPLYRHGTVRYLRGELQEGTPQDERFATYSIWRDMEDYRIDWGQDAEVIERTVRALGRPYQGAQSLLRGQRVVLDEVEVLPDLPFAIRQPGKVWALDSEGRPSVVCGRGMVRVLAAQADGKSILPMRSLRVRFT